MAITAPPASIFKAFIVCTGMFAAMSVYGATTKKDLTGWGSFLFMGLIGIVIASIVNIFMASSALDFVISGIGVLIFTGLTAYDTQKIKEMGESAPMDDALAADQIFSVLMGEDVESRRNFIQQNAKDVRFLDI